MSAGLPWLCPCCGVSLGSSDSVKSSSAPVSARSSWPWPWPCPVSVGPTFTSAKNRSKISSNTSSSRRSLISATRRAALRSRLSASIARLPRRRPSRRGPRGSRRGPGAAAAAARTGAGAFPPSACSPRGRSRAAAAAQARAEAAGAAVRRHLRLRTVGALGLDRVAGPVVAGVVAALGVLRPPGSRGRRSRRRRQRQRRATGSWCWSCVCARGRARGRGRGRRAPGPSRSGRRGGAAPRACARTSRSYLTTTAAVSDSTDAVSSSTPSTASVRAQSIVSEMRRRLAQLQLPDPAHDLDQLRRQRVGQPGVLGPHDLQLALRRRVVEEQVQAAALERGREVAGVVRWSG